jgi:hypothetical protein
LQKEDGVYLDQPQIGNVVTLAYKASIPANATKTQSFIMHSKGYYEYIREFTNKPDVAFLQKITQPGAFSAYGASASHGKSGNGWRMIRGTAGLT